MIQPKQRMTVYLSPDTVAQMKQAVRELRLTVSGVAELALTAGLPTVVNERRKHADRAARVLGKPEPPEAA